MARLPGERYLIQQIDGQVILFEDGSEREIVRFNPADANDAAKAQKVIYDSELTDEEKCYAHFWAGYFYAHAGGAQALFDVEDVVALMEALATAMTKHETVLSGRAWGAYDKLRAQLAGSRW